MREMTAGEFRIEFDLASQVLRLHVPEDREAVWDDRDAGAVEPARITRRFPVADAAGFVSASALAFKAKQFDDGLHAAVELAVQEGCGRLGSKRSAILACARALAAGPPDARASEVTEILAAAAELGGSTVAWPSALDRHLRSRIESFASNPVWSKPLGFYTWTPELEASRHRRRAIHLHV